MKIKLVESRVLNGKMSSRPSIVGIVPRTVLAFWSPGTERSVPPYFVNKQKATWM